MSFDDRRFDLCLALGKTFSQPLAFTDGTPVFKTIESVAKGAPTQLTITGHGVPNGWPFLIESAEGMTALNRAEAWQTSVVDVDTIAIASLNSKDFDDYVANSGVILYSQPADLSDYTGVLSARATRTSSDVLFTLTGSHVNIDAASSRVTLQMTAAETTALIDTLDGLDTLAYDLELTNSGGVTDLWTWGDIAILRDV